MYKSQTFNLAITCYDLVHMTSWSDNYHSWLEKLGPNGNGPNEIEVLFDNYYKMSGQPCKIYPNYQNYFTAYLHSIPCLCLAIFGQWKATEVVNLFPYLELICTGHARPFFNAMKRNNWKLSGQPLTYCEGSQSSPDCFIIALSLSSSDASAFAKSATCGAILIMYAKE